MAKLEIIIPDELVDEIAASLNYQELILDGTEEIQNPTSKSDHAKSVLIEYLRMRYREYKANEAVLANINTLDNII
jgi:hypothetical protein